MGRSNTPLKVLWQTNTHHLQKRRTQKNTVTSTIVIYEVYRKINHRINAPNLFLEATDISLIGLAMADSIIVATAKAYNAPDHNKRQALKGNRRR